MLKSDPNARGLMVCDADLDELDPWRMAAPPADRIALRFARPDTTLDAPTTPYVPGPTT